jgi:hypothetical protein
MSTQAYTKHACIVDIVMHNCIYIYVLAYLLQMKMYQDKSMPILYAYAHYTSTVLLQYPFICCQSVP